MSKSTISIRLTDFFFILLLIFDWRADNRQIKMSNYLSWSLCKKEFSPPFDTKITTLMSDWLFIALQTCNVTKEGEGIIKTFHLLNWYWYHIDIFLLPLWKCQSTEKQLCFYTRLKHLLKKRWHLGKVSFQNIWENVTFNCNG